jgi:hypothetical protein
MRHVLPIRAFAIAVVICAIVTVLATAVGPTHG